MHDNDEVKTDVSLQLADRLYAALEATEAGQLRWEAFFDTATAPSARST